MKKTALSPSNIAFIKYWGKANEELRLPLNDSFSMNLTGAYTTTTVEFSSAYATDQVSLIDGTFSEKEIARVIKGLDRIRQKANIHDKAKVVTKNTFPKGGGAAASASGFAALTVAGCAAAGLTLSEKELTIVARIGSGSACRSIPDGFVLWEKGENSDTSFAYSVYPHDYWDLRDVLVIVSSKMKKVSTSDGMELVSTSSLLQSRLQAVPKRLNNVKLAFEKKDFSALGTIMEEDCLDMHHVMHTQKPPLEYWNDQTNMLMNQVQIWRKSGLAVYFTIDAGPNVHLIVEGKDEQRLLDELKQINGIETVIGNKPSEGTKLIEEHLF